MSLRDLILAADDLKREAVEVPEWGTTVYVRTMTGTERDAFEQQIVGDESGRAIENIRARLCILTIVDDKGERQFADGDISAVGGKSSAALDRVFAVAQRLNGLSKSDVDTLAKN